MSRVSVDPMGELIDNLDRRRPGEDLGATAMLHARMAVIVTDPRRSDNPIVFANQSFLAMTGYAADEVTGRNCRFLQGADTRPETILELRAAIERQVEISVDILNYRKSGEAFWNALHIAPVFDEQGELVHFLGTMSDATERVARQHDQDLREAERARRTLDLEKAMQLHQMLMQEIDHRVKNNLQMVSAMLTLQAMSIPDSTMRRTLQEMLERVDALGLVHKRLYQLSQNTRFDLADFTTEIVHDIIGASGRKDIAVDLRLDPTLIRADSAASIGLILNEALINAVKHAFANGRPGRLSVDLRTDNGLCSVAVADDGAGFSPEPGAAKNFGTTLVETLGEQIHATLTWDRADPGTVFRVSFPIEAPQL